MKPNSGNIQLPLELKKRIKLAAIDKDKTIVEYLDSIIPDVVVKERDMFDMYTQHQKELKLVKTEYDEPQIINGKIVTTQYTFE